MATAGRTAGAKDGRLEGKVVSSYNVLTGQTIATIEDAGGRRCYALGDGLKLVIGEKVSMRGTWGPGEGLGRCLLVEEQRAPVPNDVAKAAAHLMRGLGVDFAAATRLMSNFGGEIFEILDKGAESRLAEANYSGPEIRQYLENWRTFRSREAAQTLIERLDLNESQRTQIVDALGASADLDKALRENPYLAVLHVPEADWLLTDRLGVELGLAKNSAERRKAAALCALRSMGESGHTYLPVHVLQSKAERLLDLTPSQANWDSCFQWLRSRRLIAFDGDRAYLPEAFEQAAGAAKAVLDSAGRMSDIDPPDVYSILQNAVDKDDFRLPKSHFDLLSVALGRAITVVDVAGLGPAIHLAESFIRVAQSLRLSPVVITPSTWVSEHLLARQPDARIGLGSVLFGVGPNGATNYDNIRAMAPDAMLVIGAEQLSMPALMALLTRRIDGSALILAGDPRQDVGMVRGRPFMDLVRAAETNKAALPVMRMPDSIGGDSPLRALMRLSDRPEATEQLVGRFDLPLSVLTTDDPSKALPRYITDVLPRLGIDPANVEMAVAMTRKDSLPRALHVVRELRKALNPVGEPQTRSVGRTYLAPGDPFVVPSDITDPVFVPAGTRMKLQMVHENTGPVTAELHGVRLLLGGDRVGQIAQGYAVQAHHLIWQSMDVIVVAIPAGGEVPNGARVLYSLAAATRRRLVLLGSPQDVRTMLSAEKRPPWSLFEWLLGALQRSEEAAAA